jgi:hypothetical protein
MSAYVRRDNSVTLVFERQGEPTIRLAVPEDKAMLRSIVLLLAHRELKPADRLSIVSGDGADDDDLPAVSRGSHYGG